MTPAVPIRSDPRSARRSLATFDRHGAVLHAVATVLTRTPHRAQQLVLATVVQSRSQWWRPSTWRAGADSRSIVERLYRRWSRDDLPRSPQGAGSDRSLRHDLHQLTDSQLGALALCGVGGHTYREAAKVMGISPGDAALVLHAALTRVGAGQTPAAA